jgi:hypothetical protein
LNVSTITDADAPSSFSFFLGLDQYIAMTLLGGLKYPIACAIGSKLLCGGNCFTCLVYNI